MQQESERPDGRTLASADSELIDALASYLGYTRGEDDVRHAIRTWCRAVARPGVQPEQVLIRFKAILRELEPAQQPKDRDVRLTEGREIIAMCIEEYFAPDGRG